LIKYVTDELDALHPHQAARALQEFWLNDLSRGYIQFVRDRISENDEEVMAVLNKIYQDLLKLCAPMIPFITERIWQELKERKIVSEESVHLCEWPKSDAKKIDKKLGEEFEVVTEAIEYGLMLRDKEKIGLRWPLSEADITSRVDLSKYGNLLKGQLNVKRVKTKIDKKLKNTVVVWLDSAMTPELEAEGYAREFARKIQAERKNAKLKKGDMIALQICVSEKIRKMFEKHLDFLKERTNSKEIKFVDKIEKNQIEFKIKDDKIAVKFH
jgi:isoleucyl-tRNA synthetase